MKCNAKTRTGTPCKRSPAKGSTRCRLHGGATPKGIDSPHFKHGMYSKYAGESLKQVLSDLENFSSDELINPENEIRLMQALIISAEALKNDIPDLKDLDTLSKIIDRLVTAKQRSMMIQVEQQRLVPVSDIERFLDYVETLLIDRIGDDGYAIIEQFKNFKLSQN